MADPAAACIPAPVLSLTSDGMAERARQHIPQGHGIAHRLYRSVFGSGRFAPESFSVGMAAVDGWRRHFSLDLPTVVSVVEEEGSDGITAKAILALADGARIECVRIPMGDHGTVCLSSQVGCRMGCTFCETGRMGLVRNLTPAEIVGEVVVARAVLGWDARNLVFMGMGEPLDNVDSLIPALHILADRRGYHYSQERITICTSGHGEGLVRLRELGWKRLNLSISLNAGSDALRRSLMPVNRRTPLMELKRLLQDYPQRRNFTLGVNYCLLPGINDRPQDAADVASFCQGLGRVLLNLIPYNPGSSPIARAPDEVEIATFMDLLRDQGLPVQRRRTKGRSIMAACGQLGDPSRRRARWAIGTATADPAMSGPGAG